MKLQWQVIGPTHRVTLPSKRFAAEHYLNANLL